MAKYYGKLGIAETVETSPGVWEEQITERPYRGDVIKNSRRYEGSEYLNDNLILNNSLSIVCDSYLSERIFAIRYVTWMGARWKVSNIEVQRPRLILTLGGVYNGPEA